jgi:hypothetical protein
MHLKSGIIRGASFVGSGYIRGTAFVVSGYIKPRRISAVSIAERVAQERSEELGVSIGYSVRFESIFPRPYCGVLYCTVGE